MNSSSIAQARPMPVATPLVGATARARCARRPARAIRGRPAHVRLAAGLVGLAALALGGVVTADTVPTTTAEARPSVYVAASPAQAAALQDYVTQGLVTRQLPPGSVVLDASASPER